MLSPFSNGMITLLSHLPRIRLSATDCLLLDREREGEESAGGVLGALLAHMTISVNQPFSETHEV